MKSFEHTRGPNRKTHHLGQIRFSRRPVYMWHDGRVDTSIVATPFDPGARDPRVYCTPTLRARKVQILAQKRWARDDAEAGVGEVPRGHPTWRNLPAWHDRLDVVRSIHSEIRILIPSRLANTINITTKHRQDGVLLQARLLVSALCSHGSRHDLLNSRLRWSRAEPVRALPSVMNCDILDGVRVLGKPGQTRSYTLQLK